jgi:hypothetical protein
MLRDYNGEKGYEAYDLIATTIRKRLYKLMPIKTAGKFNKKLSYIMLHSALVMVAMVSLTACGGAVATPTTTSAPVPPTATTVAAIVPEPEATATAVMEAMDDMAGMEEATPSVVVTDGAAPGGPVPTAPIATPEDSSNGGTSGATEINAVLKEWAIDMDQGEVSAGTATFVVTNEGRMDHNLTVLDSNGSKVGGTPNFRGSDGAQTFEVTLAPGTYTIVCSLPGHAQRGQQTELVVK